MKRLKSTNFKFKYIRVPRSPMTNPIVSRSVLKTLCIKNPRSRILTKDFVPLVTLLTPSVILLQPSITSRGPFQKQQQQETGGLLSGVRVIKRPDSMVRRLLEYIILSTEMED